MFVLVLLLFFLFCPHSSLGRGKPAHWWAAWGHSHWGRHSHRGSHSHRRRSAHRHSEGRGSHSHSHRGRSTHHRAAHRRHAHGRRSHARRRSAHHRRSTHHHRRTTHHRRGHAHRGPHAGGRSTHHWATNRRGHAHRGPASWRSALWLHHLGGGPTHSPHGTGQPSGGSTWGSNWETAASGAPDTWSLLRSHGDALVFLRRRGRLHRHGHDGLSPQ